MSCRGQLKGDPDIAGIGTTTSIFATVMTSHVICGGLWYLRMLQKDERSVVYRTMTRCAFLLGDIHLITALAMIVASLKIIYADVDTSLYHIFVSVILVQANLTGYGSAMIFGRREQTNARLRLALYVVTSALYVCLISKSIEEFRNVDYRTPRCFYTHSRTPGSILLWLYIEIPWVAVMDIWTYAEAHGGFNDLLDDLDRDIFTLGSRLSSDVKSLWKAVTALKVIEAPVNILNVAWRLMALCILALTLCPPTTRPFLGLFFTAWHWVEIHWVRSANEAILVAMPESHDGRSLQGNANPEDDWGFGQVMPLLLLILVALQFADAWVEEKQRDREEASRPRIDPEVIHRQHIDLVRQ